MDFRNFIKPELLILIPVLYAIGMGIKKSEVPDKRIPFILGTIGVLLCILWVFATSDCSNAQAVMMAVYTAITQGVMVAAASVFANQIYVQSKKQE